MKITELARKKALKNVSAPEELDRALKITPARDWIWASTVVFVALAGLLWGWFGRIPVSVNGQGVLLPYEPVINIPVRVSGTVKEIHASVGDQLKKGQLIIVLENKDIYLKMQAAEVTLKMEKLANSALTKIEGQQLESAKEKLKIQQRASRYSELIDEDILKFLSQEEEREKKLYDERLLTANQYLQTKQQLATIRNQLDTVKVARIQNLLTYEQLKVTLASSRTTRKEQIANAEHQLEQVRLEYVEATMIRAVNEGKLTSLMVERFESIDAGVSVATLLIKSPKETVLRCISFLSAKKAKAIENGMAAFVSPTIAEKERFGFLMGEVEQIALTPVNENEIKGLIPWGFHSGSTGSLLQVDIKLIKTDNTVSGYEWSSERGYPHVITEGTLANVEVVLESRRPISFVLPWIKKKVGL